MNEPTFDFDVDGAVGIWDLRRMGRADPANVQGFLEVAVEQIQRPAIRGAVVRLPDDGDIGREVLDLVEQYNEFFAGNDVEHVALVSSDVKNLAIKSRLDVPGMTVNTLRDEAAAVEWARADV